MLDYWEVNPPEGASRDPRIVSPLGNFFPDWLTWSQREYGARVGIFRVLDVLDRFGVTPSVALGVRGGEALSGAGGRTDPPQRLLPGARHATPRGASPAG